MSKVMIQSLPSFSPTFLSRYCVVKDQGREDHHHEEGDRNRVFFHFLQEQIDADVIVGQ
jgi:hypothetical protein